jgi:hypothetical protein
VARARVAPPLQHVDAAARMTSDQDSPRTRRGQNPSMMSQSLACSGVAAPVSGREIEQSKRSGSSRDRLPGVPTSFYRAACALAGCLIHDQSERIARLRRDLIAAFTLPSEWLAAQTLAASIAVSGDDESTTCGQGPAAASGCRFTPSLPYSRLPIPHHVLRA